MDMYQHEFGATMPTSITDALATGELIDHSWRNDMCPSFAHRDAPVTDTCDLRLWVHPENPADREMEDLPRFAVAEHAEHQAGSLLETDGEELALLFLKALAATYRADADAVMAPVARAMMTATPRGLRDPLPVFIEHPGYLSTPHATRAGLVWNLGLASGTWGADCTTDTGAQTFDAFYFDGTDGMPHLDASSDPQTVAEAFLTHLTSLED